MKRVQTIAMLLLLSLVISSCSKQKQIARRLEGMWQVDVYQKTVYGDGNPILAESGSAGNAGTFEFFDDGKGKYNILKNLGNNMFYGDEEFVWTNTSDAVSIRTNSGATKKFDVITNKNDKMVFERSQPYPYGGGQPGVAYTMDERITLVK